MPQTNKVALMLSLVGVARLFYQRHLTTHVCPAKVHAWKVGSVRRTYAVRDRHENATSGPSCLSFLYNASTGDIPCGPLRKQIIGESDSRPSRGKAPAPVGNFRSRDAPSSSGDSGG
ncbi:unnamed protein product [Periconia digitata]|uniref:Secreted protein n=1 Tax=Periconia digitata TaxID=1303443 RepID=A0A9W4XU20_9PLEO|nr:unnamed protein product [Periconia digitata]